MGQEDFGKHFKAKLVSQFMQTKFSCHKMSQNSTVLAVSYSSDCTYYMLEGKWGGLENALHFWIFTYEKLKDPLLNNFRKTVGQNRNLGPFLCRTK